ncbi:hypothetical protein BH688_13120 [Kushneria phosphatilytica]|nr:hypothetical protein BH688_13120 [Kushneria phosphatilytica]
MTHARLDDIAAIEHGFGTRHSLVPPVLAERPSARPQCRQVHGTTVVTVTRPGQACGEADGLLTTRAGIPLGIATADCLPILLAHRNGQAVAALHAGWRGLLAGIIERMIECMQTLAPPEEWVAVIGPAASMQAYEVSETLVARFCQELSIPESIISPQWRRLDLAGMARHKLSIEGVGTVADLDQCTMTTLQDGRRGTIDGFDSDAYRYNSYRRHCLNHPDASTRPRLGNQQAGIMIRER